LRHEATILDGDNVNATSTARVERNGNDGNERSQNQHKLDAGAGILKLPSRLVSAIGVVSQFELSALERSSHFHAGATQRDNALYGERLAGVRDFYLCLAVCRSFVSNDDKSTADCMTDKHVITGRKKLGISKQPESQRVGLGVAGPGSIRGFNSLSVAASGTRDRLNAETF
jgi:hypothetical protein